ncbi:MAG TPA: site-2 protease family protein [Allosphingosinicella sp.]|jgi:membrane-associated protease RseP (regulator of RpoE activity)|nr:site-2 protease family protein [Allosphingosinicella sp.]
MRHIATMLFVIVNLAVFAALSELRSPAGWFLYIPLTLLLSFIVILVHELGHALAAHRHGRRIERFVALPFELRFRPWRLRLAEYAGGRDLGGEVVYALDWPETRREHALVAAAGPAANFLLALIAVLLATWIATSAAPGLSPLTALGPDSAGVSVIPNALLPSDAEVVRVFGYRDPLTTATSVALLLKSLALLSAGTGLANLIPYKGSDGDAIVDALFRGRFRG